MPSKIDALFGDLQSRGFAKDKSLQQFRDYMLAPGEQGYKNRKAFYDDFKSRGMTNIGSYEEFSRFLNLAPKGQAPVQKQTEAWWESDPAFQQDQQQHTEKVYNPAEDTMGAFVGAAIAQPPKQQPQPTQQLDYTKVYKPEQPQKKQEPYNPTWQERWAMGITLNQAGNDVANATRPIDQRQQNAKIYQEKALGQRPELGRKGRVVEDNGGYIDEEGTRHNVMVDANARQRELETDYTDSLKAQLDAYYGERERIQKEIDNTPQDWVDADGRTHSVSAADKQKRAELIAQYQDIDKQIKELNNNPRIAAERENDPGFLGVTKYKLGAGFAKAGLGLLNTMEALAGGMIVEDASSPTGYSKSPDYDPIKPNNAVSRGLKQANEYVDDMSRKGEVRGGRSFTDLLLDGDIGGFLLKGWGTGLESAPMTLSAYNPYTMTLNAISMAGNNFRDNTIDNPDIPGWKRAAMAIGSAAIEQAVEKYSDPIFKYVGGSSKKVTQEVVDEATKTIAGRIKNVLKDAAGEGFEEVMTNFGNDVLGQSLDWLDGESDYGIVAQWRDLKKQNPNADLGDFAMQKAKENIDAFFGGALAGAYTSGGAQATVAGLQYAFGGKVSADEITSNPNQPVHPATVDIAQSFDRGFAYETDEDKNAVADRYTANRQQALALVDEETLNKIDRDPMQALGNLDQYGLDTEGQQVLGEYIGSKAEYDGMQQRIIEDHRASRPNYVVNGNNIDEVDAEGNVVATHEYADAEEMKTGLWELQAMRDYSDMQADINMARLNPRHDYDSLVAAFAGEEGMTPEEVEQLINTSPLDRSEEADEVVSRFAELLHNTLYDSTTVHEEQSAQDGATLADAMGIDLNNLSPQQAQQAAQLTETLNTAKQALDAAFAANEDLAQEVQRMEQQGMPHQGIVSSLDTFRPAEVQAVIDFYNAQAKYQGFLNQMAQKIDEEAANSRKRHTLNGTINGNADLSNVYTITDGTNEYYLVSGDVTTDPATGRITGSNSGLIIGMDLDGSLVQLGDGSGYSVMQPTMSLDQFEEAERTRLQEQITSVIDPIGVMDNSQQGNEEFQPTEQQVPTDGTNSSTQGNEPEPSSVIPTQPVNSPSPAGGAAQTPVTIESVTDKDGIKRYEQGIPVDDAIIDIQNDSFDVNEVADASIAEAQQTIDKINQKSTKTRKDLIDRKNAQDIIDYYNNVKVRWAEMNAPAESEENVNIQPEQPAVEEKPVSSQSKLTVEEQKQQRIAEAKAKYGELFDDDFTKANDVFELVSMWVGRKRNLAWDDVNGKRGLQKELGWTRKIGGDTKFIETLLAANGEGMGVDEFVHMVWESPENSVNGEKRWDDTEIKNALLELLKSARSKSDVVDYALNTRIKAAEAALEAQQQRQQEIEETGEAQVENLTAEQIADMEANLPFAQSTDEDIPDSPITLLGKAIAELQKQEGMPGIKLVDTDRMNGSDWIDLTSQVYGGAFMDEETVNEVRDYALTTGVIRDDDGTILVFSDSQTPEDVKSKIQTILDYANTLQEEGRNDGRDTIVERTETKTPQEQEPATPATEGATDSESQGGSESDPDGIASRITENGEPTEEPSDNGTVYKQEYLIDGKHSVTKVDEPNNKGDYTGSYYLYNGKRYGDLNEIVRDIDISERHQKEYDEYIKPLLSRTDEELQQMAKKKEDAVNGELKQLEGDLEYSAIKNVLAQREIDRERKDVKDFIENTIDDEDVTFVDKVTQKELDELNHLIDEYGVDDSEGKIEDYVKRLRKKYPADKKNITDNPVEAIEQAAQSFREEQKKREEKKQENKPRYGADNKLVTTDRYEELKKRMKEKLLGQANVGFDPEILSIGTEMAVYHVEAGARKFTEFAQRMIEELGDAIRPYLKAIYNGAREMPGMEELRKEMTSYEEVSVLDVQNITKDEDNSVNVNKQEDNEPKKDVNLQQEPASELEGDSAEFADRQQRIDNLTKRIAVALEGVVFRDESRLTFANIKAMAKKEGIDDISDTDLQELVEAEIVNLAREIANKENLTEEKKFQKIVKLYEGQPSLNVRDNDRINKQQYSTPAPMAFLMGKFLKEGKEVKNGLEPSAGNGMLTLNLPKEAMHVNDIDEMRLSNLAKQGFGEVTNQDGTQPFGEKQYDVVVTNPPFGSVTPKVYDGLYEISALEHQMAINALESMKDDGRAAIIIGGNTEYNTNGTIKGKDRAFLNYLYAHYNVVDVINMDGKTLYSRQGTGYPTRMILINGRKEFNQKDFAPVQSKARAEQVKSYDELFKRVNDDILRNEEHNGDTSNGVHSAESGQDGGLSDNGHVSPSNEKGVRGVRSGNGSGEHQLPTESNSGVRWGDASTDTREGQGSTQPETDGGLGARTVLLHEGGNQPEQPRRSETIPGRDKTREVADGGSNTQRLPGGSVESGKGLASEQPEHKRELGEEKVAYRKQSGNPFDLQSKMPAEQAEVVKKALEELGDVDEFLVNELGYSSKEELYSALAAEQIDSVALAIHQMKKGDAFIIGDQTGVGKGRQGAALIRWAVKQGNFPVYFTKTPDLFSGVYRDLKDIHSSGLRPFILASDEKGRITERQDGKDVVIYDLPSKKEVERVLDYINKNGKLPPEYDYVVTTYSQVSGGTMEYENGQKKARTFKKGKSARPADINGQKKRDAIESLASSSIVLMDESHEAGGESARGSYLQYVSTKAKGITYISATFAKRPDNMPLYSLRTAISKAGVKVDELIDAVKRGGATFQEIMSKALTEAGQMIRRERDMRGVTVDWRGIEDEEVIKRHYEQYDKIIGLFNDIIDFQRRYVDPIVNKKNDDAAEEQGEVEHTPGTRDMGINNTPFASRTYNMVQQVLLSLKAEEGAKFAVECLKKGEKPVIAVQNTNEGAANEAVGSSDEDMEMPDLSVNLKKGLQGTLRITKKDAFGNSTNEMIPFNELSEAGRARYQEIMDAIESASTGLSLSPIDVIRNVIKKAGYSVEELTGRSKVFDYNEDGTVKRTARDPKKNKKRASDFNEGTVDALIVNKSACTGIDLHAGIKFKNTDQRHMITVQAQGDINDEVQMRGRTDRTGQKQHSKYTYIVSSIPSEQRLLMMLKSKLRSLDANTTSSQKSKFNEMQVQDIINKYGDDIVIQYLAEHTDLAAKMVDPLKWGEGFETIPAETLIANAKKDGEAGKTASKVLGRMALLKVAEQEKMLAEIGDLYQAEIDRLNEMGENDLEITEMPLRAKTLKKDVWEEGVEPGGNNPFADNSYVEEVEMDVLRKPMKAEEVKKSQARLLGGKTWDEYKQEQLDKVNAWWQQKRDETTDTFKQRAEKKATAEKEKYIKGAKKAQEKNGMTDEEIERNGQHQYDHFYDEEFDKMFNALDAIDKQKQAFVDALDTFTTDGVYALPTDIYDLGQLTFEPSFGKVIDIKISDNFSTTASTISFATLDGRRKITIPISGMVKQNNGEKRDIKPVIIQQTAQTRNGMFGSNVANTLKVLEQNVDNWDKLTSTATRKKGYIITGNLLKALTSLRSQGKGGKLISYTTDTGEIRQGILMGDNFDPGALTSKNPISSAKADLDDWGTNRKITSADGDVTIKADGYGSWMSYTLKVPKSKKKGEKYFNDKTLLSLMDGQFEGSSALKADFKAENLDAVLKRLDELGVTVESAKEDSDAPKRMITTSDPMEAIEQAAESWRQSNRKTATNSKLQEIADMVNGLSSRSDLKGSAPTYSINSRQDLEAMKGKVSSRVYREIERLYADPDNGAAYIPRAGIVVVFGEHLEDAKEAEAAWWHEQTHSFWQKLPENERRKFGYACFDWLRKNRPDIYNHITKPGNYERYDWLNEACAFLIGNVVIESNGTEKFLNGNFVGNPGICNFANELRNHIKNGRQGSTNTGNNQLRRIGEGEQTSATEVRGSSQQGQGRENNIIRPEAESELSEDPIEAIEQSAKRWRIQRKEAAEESEALKEYSAKQVYNERLNRVETMFAESWQDDMVSFKTGQDAIAHDEDIPDSQNAYQAMNLSYGKTYNEQEHVKNFYEKPLKESLNKVLNVMGWRMGDLERYLFTKHGLERNRELFTRDWFTAERSKRIKDIKELSQEAEEIYLDKESTIEELFEDGDIETEEQKQKALMKALQEAHDEWLSDLQEEYDRIKQEGYVDMTEDKISFAQYLEKIDSFIRQNIDEDYVASEHDYSGFTEMYGDEDGKFDEDAIISSLADNEDAMGEDLQKELWNRINNLSQYGLEKYRTTGMMSDETSTRVSNMFHWYVPMRGYNEGNAAEDHWQYMTQKEGASRIGGLLKKAKGRKSQAGFPLATLLGMTYKAIADANQNVVRQHFWRLCRANPNDLVVLSDSWVVVDPSTGEWITAYPEIDSDMSGPMKEAKVKEFQERMRALEQEGNAKKLKGREHFDYKVDEKHRNEHIVEVLINGERKQMIITGNPRMAQALNGLLRYEGGKSVFAKANARLKHFMQSMSTSYSATFVGRNMSRDWTHFGAILAVREGAGYEAAAQKYYWSQMPKMMSLFKKYREGTLDMEKEMERDFKDFMDNGGITGFVHMQKVETLQKDMEKFIKEQGQGKTIKLNNNVWSKILDTIEAANEAVENNARFATYRASRHYAGRTRARSAYDAKEVTVNFNKKGAGRKTAGFKSDDKNVERAAKVFGSTGQILAANKMFFNATVQAICTIFKNFQKKDGSLNWSYIGKFTARYAIPPFVMAMAVPVINDLLLSLAGGGDGDDPYANLPEWTRRKSICLYMGWVPGCGKQDFLVIPIGQELAAFYSLGDMAAGLTYKPELKPVDKSLDDEILGFFNVFSPVDFDTKVTDNKTFAPVSEYVGRVSSVAAPLVAIGENMSWMGRPIFREDKYNGQEFIPEYKMTYNSTNKQFVAFSKWLNDVSGGDDVARGWIQINPGTMQYLVEQYTGGPGKLFANTFVSAGKDLKNAITGGEVDFNIRKIEGVRAFYTQGDDRTEFYRAQAKYRKYKKEADELDYKIRSYENDADVNPEHAMKLNEISKGVGSGRLGIIKEADKNLMELNTAANQAEGADRKNIRALYNNVLKEVVNELDMVQEIKDKQPENTQ